MANAEEIERLRAIEARQLELGAEYERRHALAKAAKADHNAQMARDLDALLSYWLL